MSAHFASALHLTQRSTPSCSAGRDGSREGSTLPSLTGVRTLASANQLVDAVEWLVGCCRVGVGVWAVRLSCSICSVAVFSTGSVWVGDPAPACPRLWEALRSGSHEPTPIIG